MAISKTSAIFRKTGGTLDFTPGEDTPTAYTLLGNARGTIGVADLTFEVVCA